MEQFIFSFTGLYIVALLGMLTHFLKKNVKGETPTEILSYFKDNFRSTLTAFILTSVMYFAYYNLFVVESDVKDLMVIFLIGYAFDSTFIKYEATTEVPLKR
jgi:preprotein translocase subunit SecF